MDHSHHAHHDHHSSLPNDSINNILTSTEKTSIVQTFHEHSSSDHNMKMYFHGGFDEIVLFDFWRINSTLGVLNLMPY
uniref:Uncharacterized protein n=1 Tax=Meloidogyne floridensis TaxID=298350 RepID=A0A915NN56_9BILA